MRRGELGFRVRFDERSSVLEVEMIGFWSLDVHAAYEAEAGGMRTRLRDSRRWFGEIVDNRAFPVQSAEVGAALVGSVDSARVAARAPTGLIVSGALSRLQAERIGNAPHLKVVTSRAEAIAWVGRNAPAGWSAPSPNFPFSRSVLAPLARPTG